MTAPTPGDGVTAGASQHLKSAAADRPSATRPGRRFVAVALVVTVVLAGVVSVFASSSPDGLDSVTLAGCTVDPDGEITGGTCIAEQAREHGLSGSPFAGYETRGVSSTPGTGISGVLGVLVTLLVVWGLVTVLRRTARPGSGRGGGRGQDEDSLPGAPAQQSG
ncbi:MAG: PDGLE domain-containing protein [Angustibacter sp.]